MIFHPSRVRGAGWLRYFTSYTEIHFSSCNFCCLLIRARWCWCFSVSRVPQTWAGYSYTLVLRWNYFRRETEAYVMFLVNFKQIFISPLWYSSPFLHKLNSELTNIKMLGNFPLDVLNFVFLKVYSWYARSLYHLAYSGCILPDKQIRYIILSCMNTPTSSNIQWEFMDIQLFGFSLFVRIEMHASFQWSLFTKLLKDFFFLEDS